VVAGVASGVGKTTATVGLCNALRARGLSVALFKCGPDYLDPTYHHRASGKTCHNLDGWLMGHSAALRTFARAAKGADVAIIEGVMGLFDGASATGEAGSTAEMAKWLSAPVLLVADASGMARSFAALLAGFAGFDGDVRLVGAVANRLGSRGHLDLLRQAVKVPPILGGFPRADQHAFPDRHLGLRTADEEVLPQSRLDAWGALVAEWWNVDAVLDLARSAPAVATGVSTEPAATPSYRCRIGIALDEAFHFYYEDNLARLVALGAELVPFSPTHDQHLPDLDGLYIGGGYPEVHAGALAGNTTMAADIAAFARRGRPIYAECGGLMYLCQAIRTLDGRTFRMVGLLPGHAVMSDRLEALGYVEVETRAETSLGGTGLRFRGHQFRYSRLEGVSGIETVYSVRRRRGGETAPEGYRMGSVLASYVHAHWASNPLVAEGFVRSCARV
jgi:cobyrinic acid a,c-diamide synthase